ncbi:MULTISPECIES: GNAT family N-acetyltransferase [Halocynthiibacter]|uniref:GNAT family N-acetyltransferase n=1 Tax=Halocynthiibacter halioticoli TaxID=2986804 RepID=A0AAE3IZA5_9RHOB|nr:MULTISPECIES: GNAT family N-acetyltransferase [Halocynthiibacter]MCV6823231.1 GNAT family N-acetyltransferase [Halocynthiibacter halioticoli]MCW4056232.1 GNAT family N-acetyltransferase [Halocynthiibacter sp. SDUM655004]
MTHPTLRPATHDDSEAIRTCIADAFTKARAEISDFPDVTFGIEESIGAGLAFVAEAEGCVCGALTVHVTDDYLKVEVVAVDSAYRGFGIGRLLMEFAVQEAKRRGVRELRLRTHILMPENVALYQHLGWEVTSEDETGVNMAFKL